MQPPAADKKVQATRFYEYVKLTLFIVLVIQAHNAFITLEICIRSDKEGNNEAIACFKKNL